MPFDLLATQSLADWIMVPIILVAGPLLVIAGLIVRGRHDRIRVWDEADWKHVKVLSIRRCWLPCSFGPFAWFEYIVPGCRVYRLRAREQSGTKRTAYVLIGPRRFVWGKSRDAQEERMGTLTWRWAEPRRSAGR